MQPVSPVLGPEFQGREITFAKNQPQFIPIPVHRNRMGVLLSRWRLTDDERAAIAAGADIFLSSFTRNESLLPCMIEVGNCDRDILEMAAQMELIREEPELMWECETCHARYGEYVNGCVHCWNNGEVRSAVRRRSDA